MRRILLVLTLVAIGIAHNGFPSHDGPQPKRRKTLGFGPDLPHSVFVTAPDSPSIQSFGGGEVDPFGVAKAFIEHIHGNDLSASNTYTIRKDSYTDKNTGVTHVYARQIVNGIEVADGDINVNVKDGKVISYGNSFYSGANTPYTRSPNYNPHPHQHHCNELAKVKDEQGASSDKLYAPDQVILDTATHGDNVDTLLGDLHEANCGHISAEAIPSHESDHRHALLRFMLAATPNPSVVNDIEKNFNKKVAAMSTHYENQLVGDHNNMIAVVDNVPDAVNPVKVKQVYVQVPKDGATELHPAWKFEVEMQDNWYEATVALEPPYTILSVVDWASDSSIPYPTPPKAGIYNVFPWGVNDPEVAGRSIRKENIDSLASPAGWHSLPFANDPQSKPPYLKKDKSSPDAWRNTTTTWGNNVFAHENWEGRNDWVNNYRPDAGKDKNFNFVYDPKTTNKTDALEEAKKYINTTITQLFYTSNMVHDLYYRYGFDEVSGNFQQYNFGRGGEENDAVIANAQDGSGYNNANFMTPPDGQNGRCRMYLWNTAVPYRDGDLEAGIVIHELSHGLSTRLTGGPANSGCLGWGESGGMGEGWGDFLATTIRSNRNYSDYPMGAWAANRPQGIRNYVYSLNDTVNPSTYKTLDQPGYWGVHAIGEVWAEFLWIVSQRLIAKHGYTDSLFPPAPLEDGTIPEGDFYRPRTYDATGKPKPMVPKHGNTLIIQLVLNGMKLQKCRPDFFDARDAIIQADEVLTDGENFCDIWLGFASRGMGTDSKVINKTPWGGGIRTNGYAVPLACRAEQAEEDWVMI